MSYTFPLTSSCNPANQKIGMTLKCILEYIVMMHGMPVARHGYLITSTLF